MKTTITFLLIAVIIIVLTIFVTQDKSTPPSTASSTNISTVDGKQIIDLTAKGGFYPRITAAKANTPTILKVTTQGTFDCSSSLIIKDLNFRKNLNPTGLTEIEIPPQKAGTKIQGVCSMGMYSFALNFN